MDPNWSHYACSVVRWVNREVGPGNPEQGVTKVFFLILLKSVIKDLFLIAKHFDMQNDTVVQIICFGFCHSVFIFIQI